MLTRKPSAAAPAAYPTGKSSRTLSATLGTGCARGFPGSPGSGRLGEERPERGPVGRCALSVAHPPLPRPGDVGHGSLAERCSQPGRELNFAAGGCAPGSSVPTPLVFRTPPAFPGSGVSFHPLLGSGCSLATGAGARVEVWVTLFSPL